VPFSRVGDAFARLHSGDVFGKVVADTTTEFLRWTLYGDTDAKERIPTAAARDDVATLDNHL
jgi:hypothetical protein